MYAPLTHVFKARTRTAFIFKVALQSLSPSNGSVQSNMLLKLCTHFLFLATGSFAILIVLFPRLGKEILQIIRQYYICHTH
jgi:hypothetical protein